MGRQKGWNEVAVTAVFSQEWRGGGGGGQHPGFTAIARRPACTPCFNGGLRINDEVSGHGRTLGMQTGPAMEHQ